MREPEDSATRRPGRPRSERVQRAIIEATLSLLAEEGWLGLSMEGIANRAGVGKGAVYRRWSSREALLTDAVTAIVSEIEIPDSGSIRQDLSVLMRKAASLYRGRSGRIMPALVAAMARHPQVASAVRGGFLASRRHALRVVLDRAVERGEVREDLDPELALDFLGGPLFYRLLVTGGPLDPEFADAAVDLMLRGIATNQEPMTQGG
jgi:AcrR family transcriptional regulator